jgi:hypothetical protein
MPEEKDSAAAKLETLGKYLREGWKKVYPVSEENLKKVNEAVQRQWEQRKQAQAEKKRSKRRSKSQDYGQGHEH